uniref:Integrase catalytic domain-containing protein n=3 Tax=Meloidogyne TaxID=189290 RepID=A0A6V7X7J3_MELEN|nr:unnamed protein product [Meloidogyne enterolobii]
MSGPIRQSLGPAKATLIRAIAEAKTILDERPNQNEEIENWTHWVQKLKNANSKLERTLSRISTFTENWTKVIVQSQPEQAERENALYEAVAGGDEGLLVKIEEANELAVDLGTSIEIGENAIRQKSIDSDRASSIRQATPNRHSQIRLPKNSLPEFYGDLNLWPSFWDNYRSAIHENALLTDIDRFNYLNGCVKGEAKKLIQNYFITEANYHIAINKLRERYGDEERIKANLRAELRALPPANKFINSIRLTTDNIDRIIQQLQQMGENINQSFISSVIEEKMPKWILLELEKAKQKAMAKCEGSDDDEPFIWDTEKVLKKLAKIIELHEKVNRMPQLENKFKNEKRQNPERNFSENARVFFNSNAQTKQNLNFVNKNNAQKSKPQARRQKPERKILPCIFCNDESHRSTSCQKYSTGEARQKKLAILKKCIWCFKDANHNICLAKYKCKLCDGTHKDIVCKKFVIEKEKSETVQQHSLATQSQAQRDILLMTRQITVLAGNGKVIRGIKAFIDPGSSRSFIKKELASKLAIDLKEAPEITINAQGMFNHATSFASKSVQLKLGLRGNWRQKLEFKEFRFCTAEKITGKIATAKLTDREIHLLRKRPKHEKINIPTENYEAEILIGMDHFWELVTNIEHLPRGICLVETLLGPIVCGKINTKNANAINCYGSENVLTYGLFENLTDQQKLYGLEGIGITDSPTENEDESAQNLFDKTITKNGNSYCVRLPRRPNAPPLPTNKNLCLSRLNSTLRKLKSIEDPPNLLEMYDKTFTDQLNEKIIEEIPEAEQETENLCHFIPHQAVYRQDKKKLRIVFDCSAHIKGHPSLNDTLYRGPVLLPKVAAVLLRWRQAKIVIACDIKAAFLMLELHKEDRDLTRFLWLRDLNKPPTQANIKILRFRRVLFGAVSSPFLLGATVIHHLRNSAIAKKYPSIAKEVENSIYMDNILLTANSEEEGKNKINIIREIFLDANMELREFLANNESVLSELEETAKIAPHKKFLGISWNNGEDKIKFSFPKANAVDWTMRKILRVLNSIFDPLGLLYPASLKARLFFQSLWELKLKWDTPLPEEKQLEWTAIATEWEDAIIELPRSLCIKQNHSSQIHIFCDASLVCYATAVYIQTISEKESKTNLVFARSRLAPINSKITIPKLELLGIVIGVRAGNFIKKEMGLKEAKTILWTDSEIALSWIASTERQPVFIANRLKEIRNHNISFRHVGTASNPADLATRGIKAKELASAKNWWYGPSWLKNEKEWPQKIITPPKDEGEEFIAQFALPKVEERKRPEIDPACFSSWEKMLMCIMFILRFLKSLLALKAHSFKNKLLEKFSINKEFSALDFKIAEIFALKEAQNRSMLTSNEKIKKEYSLFEDTNGLWRSKSRLQWSSLPRDSIEPIFLPKEDKLTQLIVLSVHKKHFHSGVQLTHYSLIQKFCGITKRSIRKILGKCLDCKRSKLLPYTLPPFPPYPIERMQKSPVFANIGLDYLGPTLVTMPDHSKHKLWVLLITCLATRAVWLDSVLDLSAKTFLNALRRFIAKRGRPSYILSDNATNFHLTAKTLDEI